MKILVAQIGARRAYAVPAVFEKAGLLERFYTDFCLSDGAAKGVRAASGLFPFLRKLASRRLPPELEPKTRDFPAEFIRYYLFQRCENGRDAFDTMAARLSDRMGEAGLVQATHLYTMLGEVTSLLVKAHAAGLTTITEIFILLSSYKKVDLECTRFSGLESASTPEWRNRVVPWIRGVLQHTSLAIAPAASVAEDLVSEFGFPADRIQVVPYAADAEWFELRNEPEPGRIFFAGTASLRKGIQYLGLAALECHADHYQFRAAGDVTPVLAAHPIMKRVEFLGRIPRRAMMHEMEKCDLFVLPTLAEGSAEVVYQAMAAGVPVITTKAAGAVIRHGLDGWIVPEADAGALAQAIRQLREDRDLRTRLAQAARLRAADFTWTQYGRRLLAAVKESVPSTSQVAA
jgi:glycosyltransferase involved in cell wall biosynthesis